MRTNLEAQPVSRALIREGLRSFAEEMMRGLEAKMLAPCAVAHSRVSWVSGADLMPVSA